MGIVTIISGIVAATPTGLTAPALQFPSMLFGLESMVNKDADETIFPAVLLFEPITSNDKLTQGGAIEETYPLRIFIADRSEIDWTPSQHLQVLDAMRELSRKFINRLRASSFIKEVKSSRRTDVMNYKKTDRQLSGVYLELEVVIVNAGPVCL